MLGVDFLQNVFLEFHLLIVAFNRDEIRWLVRSYLYPTFRSRRIYHTTQKIVFIKIVAFILIIWIHFDGTGGTLSLKCGETVSRFRAVESSFGFRRGIRILAGNSRKEACKNILGFSYLKRRIKIKCRELKKVKNEEADFAPRICKDQNDSCW